MESTLPPVEAEVRERDGPNGERLRLVVDPVSLAALGIARSAGIDAPSQLGQLPDMDDLPLEVMVLGIRLSVLETRLEAVEQWVNIARARDG